MIRPVIALVVGMFGVVASVVTGEVVLAYVCVVVGVVVSAIEIGIAIEKKR